MTMRVRAVKGLQPRLVRPPGRDRCQEGPASLPDLEADAILTALDVSGLRGRGGAGFPTGVKWRAVASGEGPRVVIANGEEGEPTSFKDRYLLRRRPHLVLDGLDIAARTVSASRAFVYVADRRAADSVARALSARAPMAGHTTEIVRVPRRYVAGEETAAVRAVDGRPALPSAKPPRPHERGAFDRPTLVQNVETLANVPFLVRHGATAFRQLGTDESSGTFLMTVLGATPAPMVIEVPFGLTLRQSLDGLEADLEGVTAVGMGGYFGGVLRPDALDVPLTYGGLRSRGSSLGCAAVWLIRNRCPLSATLDEMRFFAAENARQCGVCVNGVSAMRDVVDRVVRLEATEDDLVRAKQWARSLRGRGACALLDGACVAVATMINEWQDEIHEHLQGRCSYRA